MIRLTTPRHTFTFPAPPSDYSKILITYSQGGVIAMEKGKEDLAFGENNTAWFRLTQTETKAFAPDQTVRIQVRVLTPAGEAYASEIFSLRVSDVLNKDVLE